MNAITTLTPGRGTVLVLVLALLSGPLTGCAVAPVGPVAYGGYDGYPNYYGGPGIYGGGWGSGYFVAPFRDAYRYDGRGNIGHSWRASSAHAIPSLPSRGRASSSDHGGSNRGGRRGGGGHR